jgi:hypothetical protein
MHPDRHIASEGLLPVQLKEFAKRVPYSVWKALSEVFVELVDYQFPRFAVARSPYPHRTGATEIDSNLHLTPVLLGGYAPRTFLFRFSCGD